MDESIEKSEIINAANSIEYISHSVVSKTIIKKSTGNITLTSFDSGEGLSETTSPFDAFIQIIDGKADIVIEGKSSSLQTGEAIIIPAHSPSKVKANERFKMIHTVIKSGYE